MLVEDVVSVSVWEPPPELEVVVVLEIQVEVVLDEVPAVGYDVVVVTPPGMVDWL